VCCQPVEYYIVQFYTALYNNTRYSFIAVHFLLLLLLHLANTIKRSAAAPAIGRCHVLQMRQCLAFCSPLMQSSVTLNFPHEKSAPPCNAAFRQNTLNSCYHSDMSSLSMKRKRPIVIKHSLLPPVGLSVCLSVQCIVAKRLIGHGCGLDSKSDGSRNEAGVGICPRKGVILGVNVGCPTGNQSGICGIAGPFPNYFGISSYCAWYLLRYSSKQSGDCPSVCLSVPAYFLKLIGLTRPA